MNDLFDSYLNNTSDLNQDYFHEREINLVPQSNQNLIDFSHLNFIDDPYFSSQPQESQIEIPLHSSTGDDEPYSSSNQQQNSPSSEETFYPEPLHQNTKKITKEKRAEKRDNAKKRTESKKAKFDLDEIPEKYIPEGYLTADAKTKKKMEQQMKNRLSAQKSRDSKKEYVENLENEKARLELADKENKRRIKELEDEVNRLRQGVCMNCHPTQSQSGTDRGSSDLESPSRISFTRISNGFQHFSYVLMVGIMLIAVCVLNWGGSTDGHGFNARHLQTQLLGRGASLQPVKANYYETAEIFNYIKEPLRTSFLDEHAMIHSAIENKNKLFRDPNENLTKILHYGAPKLTLANSFTEEILSVSENAPVLLEEKPTFVTIEEIPSPHKTTLLCPGSYEVRDEESGDFDGALNTMSNLQNTGHLHIIIPKSGHNIIYDDNIVTNTRPEDVNDYVEIYAKVYFVREFELQKKV